MTDSGKWYAEFTFSSGAYIGFSTSHIPNIEWGCEYAEVTAWVLHPNGQVYHKNNNTDIGVPYGTGDTIGIAFDVDNKTLTFYKNGDEAV